jgi:flavin-binding protein dodecin
MGETVFKGTEIVGTSDQSFSHAIEVAIGRARQSLRNLSWFVVAEQRGGLQLGRLEYQVTLRVFFKLEDDQSVDNEAQPLEDEESSGGKKKKRKKRP